MKRKLSLALYALSLYVITALPAQAADVDPLILNQLSATGRADVFVKMTSTADLSRAAAIEDRTERLWEYRKH